MRKAGIAEFWAEVEKFRAALEASGEFASKRQHQALAWMWQMIDAGLRQHFRQHPAVRRNLPALAAAVETGRTTPAAAAYTLLGYLNH